MHWVSTEVLLALLGGGFIAAATSLNLYMTGRVTGMSSIFYTLINWDMKEGLMWKLMFLFGLLIIPYLMFMGSGSTGYLNGIEHMHTGYYNTLGLIVGGVLVGLGTKIGNGCTSGHAVCGIPRMAKRSIVATCLFLLCGLVASTICFKLDLFREIGDWGTTYKLTTFKYLSYLLALAAVAFGCMVVKHIYDSNGSIQEAIVSFAVGLLFGLGLAISGMCNPSKILAFLTLNADWDPSLVFVMISAVGINILTFQWILNTMPQPALLGKFPNPKAEFDMPVIIGPIIFGLGWGISGMCPGPGMLGLFFLPQGFVFLLSLAAGQLLAGKVVLPLFFPEDSHSQGPHSPPVPAGIALESPIPK